MLPRDLLLYMINLREVFVDWRQIGDKLSIGAAYPADGIHWAGYNGTTYVQILIKALKIATYFSKDLTR